LRNLKYLLGALWTIPLLPLMYYQGKRIRSKIPKLPEAQGPKGSCQPKAASRGSIQLITLGESTIAGVGVETHEQGLTGTLAKVLGEQLSLVVRWKVYARSGYTAAKVREKLVPKIQEDPGLIIVGLGGNDAFKLHSPWIWKSDIRAAIESLQERFPQIPIVFCNMPPIKEFPAFTGLIKMTVGNLVELLGKALEDVAKEFEHVHYFGEVIEVDHWLQQLGGNVKREDFFSDGVHPSKLTYQTWGQEIARQIAADKEIASAIQIEALQHPPITQGPK